MPADKSQTMDSDAKSPKKLRKILPRPQDPQLVILNQADLDSNSKGAANIRAAIRNDTPPPLLSNTVQNKTNVSNNIPKILPLNTSLPPLAVINQQGMKVNVVKAVWVPRSPGQSHERTKTMSSNDQLPCKGKPKDTKALCGDNDLCCRLCGKTFKNKGYLIDIFGEEGKSAKLQEKLHQCLPISITQSDKLPSSVCTECITVLELSYNLIITALKTDQQLRNKLTHELDSGGSKRTDVKTPQKSTHPEVVTLDISPDENSGQRGPKVGHLSSDHTYMSKGSKAHATDFQSRNKTAAKLGQPSDNGSVGSTECNLCGKVFNDIEAFLIHVESDHMNDSTPFGAKTQKAVQSNGDKHDEEDALSEISLMHCFKCKEICLDDEDLQFHLNYECVVCDVCGVNNRSRRAYVLHLKKHHEVTFEDIQRGTDKTANEKTATKTDDNHKSKGGEERIVSDTIGDGMEDDHLGDRSTAGDSLDGSAENSGSDEEHTCLVCHKVFRSRLNFEKHQKLHDPLGLERDRDSGTYKCDVCPRSYHRHDNLLKHKRLHHSGGRKYSCCFCEAQFDNPKEKFDHEKQEHTVAANEDDGVDPKKSDGVASKAKDNRLWICGHCGKALSSKMSLIEHERIHSGLRPFACEVCGRTFRTKTNLSQHLVVHTGEKNYSCPICEKVFARQSFVRQHVRSHTGEKPFMCDVCGQGFSQIGDLNRHRKRHMELDATLESVAKKRKPTDEMSTDEVKGPVEVKDSSRLSSSSEVADMSDIASDVDTIDTLACEVCSKEFRDLSQLREHRFVEHGQEFQEVEQAEMVSEDLLEEEVVIEDMIEEDGEEVTTEYMIEEDGEEVVIENMIDEDGEEVKEYVLVVPS